MPNMLISQNVSKDKHGEAIDTLEKNYTEYFNSLGIRLYPISNFAHDLDGFLTGIDYHGLILTGGGDASPSCMEGGSEELDFSSERDRTEDRLIEIMLERGQPILGICYGMQKLNCYYGGKVTDGIHKDESDKRQPRKDHSVRIVTEIYGLKGEYMVNHYHNQGIRSALLAAPLEPVAVDAQFDVVEAVVHETERILAIQWHPERPSPDDDFNKTLIKGFLRLDER